MMLRAFRRYMCCVPIALAVIGCADKEEDERAPGISLAFIPKTSNNLVFKIGFDGAEFATRSLAASTGREVEVEYLASPELDPVVEQGFVRQAIADHKDGLLVSCLDDSITAPIDEAVAAGIPVITYDSDCPDSKRLGFYSVQAEDTGAKSADLLVSAMGSGPKKVAVLTGRAGADNLERRLTAFTDRLATAYPDVTVVATVHCLETAESCGTAVEHEIIEQYPDLDGLFTAGLWGLSAACTCSDSGLSCVCGDGQMPHWKAAAKAKLKTVAYDSLPFEVMLVEQGYVSALIGQKYFGWGYDTVRLMHEHLTSGTVPGDFIDSGFDVVCPNNAAQMSANWVAANFSEPLSPACDL